MSRWLTKGVYDELRNLTVVTAKAASGKKGRSIKPPKPFPTPDELHKKAQGKAEARKPAISLRELARKRGLLPPDQR